MKNLAICGIMFLPLLAAMSYPATTEDILLRTSKQWEALEDIHRQSVNLRIAEVEKWGRFDTSVNLGYGRGFNWVDVWGPTYTCPLMRHVGTVGDGGKWLCGVKRFLQRPGCIIYSFGSSNDYSFEAKMLNETVCDIHVFDPTVTQSEMRRREDLLNGDGKKRVTWYAVGVSDVDDDNSSFLDCYGGLTLKNPPQARLSRKLSEEAHVKLWDPNDSLGSFDPEPNDTPDTEVIPEANPRDAAVQNVIRKLLNERDRIVGTAKKCGPESHAKGGIVQVPEEKDIGAGETKDLSPGPHGDSVTTCRLATLPTIMKSLGHHWIDVLKMDIEGSEYQTMKYIASLPGDAMRFTQMQLELHQGWVPDPSIPNVAQFDMLQSFLAHGFRTMFLEPNIYFAAQTCHELAFIKMDDCGNVITPAP